MVSKNEIKLITSLYQKKYRNKHQLFVVEGVKSVNEFIHSEYDIYKIFLLEGTDVSVQNDLYEIISENEMKKISYLKTPSTVLGVFKKNKQVTISNKDLLVVLDGIKDPGNLGTIIRLCDWFGVTSLVCSTDTVDCYNPKVVQATMGSLSRISINYTDIYNFLKEDKRPVYVSVMNGENIHKKSLPKDAILIMGNEANGIQERIQNLSNNKITIPKFSSTTQTESLNVATATAILLNEFRRI